jgi:hypothetical protein
VSARWVSASPRELLRSHVRKLPLDEAVAFGDACRSRDSEVRDARHPVDADQDILGRDVAVDEAEWQAVAVSALMRRLKSCENVHHDA